MLSCRSGRRLCFSDLLSCCMDQMRVSSEENISTVAPAVPVPAAPREDIVGPSPASVAESAREGVAQTADVWTNGEYSFRVDQITPAGSVRIRFRTDASLDPKPLSPSRIIAFFRRKGNAPDGEWFFGSVEEFERFADEGGYRLEKRGKIEQ